MTNSKLVVAAFAALGLTAGQAVAQDEPDGDVEGEVGVEGGVSVEGEAEITPPPETMPEEEMEGGAPGLTTPAGKIKVSVGLGVNLSKESVAKPITITPDIFYGVSDKLEVGLAHSGYAITGFWGDSSLGGGLCLTGEENGCGKLYDGPVGLLARFGVMDGPTQLAVDAGLVIAQLSDPMLMGLKVGVRGRHMAGNLIIGFAPNIYIGVTERDFNKEQLNIPVEIGFMVNEQLGVGLQTGLSGPLDGLGDFYRIPLSIGGAFMVNDNLSVGAAFTLHRVAGFEGPGAADIRGLNLWVDWHN